MSKNRKKGRMAVPPPQSRGGIRQMPKIPQKPGQPVRQEISELDSLKYRLAIQKDNNVQAQLKTLKEKKAALEHEIAQKRSAMEREEENLNLRISLTRMENRRDIGHLDVRVGDKFIEENGKFFIIRATRQGPLPEIPAVKPEPTEPKEPEVPPESPEEDPEGDEEPPEGDGGEEIDGDGGEETDGDDGEGTDGQEGDKEPSGDPEGE